MIVDITCKQKKETENQEITEQIKIFGDDESELIIQKVLQQRQIQVRFFPLSIKLSLAFC